MKRQEVNLYRAELSEKKRPLTLSRAHFGAAAAVLALVGYVGNEVWQAVHTRNKLAEAVKTYALVSNEMGDLKLQLVAQQGSSDQVDLDELKSRVAQLEQERTALERALGEEPRGFAPFLVALARQHIDGLWLTRVDIGARDSTVVLAGKTTDPALVPEYMSRLAREPVLHGVTFHSFRISAPREVANGRGEYVEFIIGTNVTAELGL